MWRTGRERPRRPRLFGRWPTFPTRRAQRRGVPYAVTLGCGQRNVSAYTRTALPRTQRRFSHATLTSDQPAHPSTRVSAERLKATNAPAHLRF